MCLLSLNVLDTRRAWMKACVHVALLMIDSLIASSTPCCPNLPLLRSTPWIRNEQMTTTIESEIHDTRLVVPSGFTSRVVSQIEWETITPTDAIFR